MKEGKSTPEGNSDKEQQVFELAEEVLDVTLRPQETGRVCVRIYTEEREQVVDEPLLREEMTMKRVPVGRVVDKASGIRQQGDTTIVPIYEEVLVVETKLVLKEEIHLTRHRSTEHDPQTFTVRQEHAAVERSTSRPTSFRSESDGGRAPEPPDPNNELIP